MTEKKELSPRAEVILSWLKDPTTKRYINKLLEDEKTISQIAVIAMGNAVSSGLTQRSEDEIKVFSDLKATRTLLSSIPYQPSQKEEELTEEDIKELENFFDQLPN